MSELSGSFTDHKMPVAVQILLDESRALLISSVGTLSGGLNHGAGPTSIASSLGRVDMHRPWPDKRPSR
jgi:hypothetical protein